MNCPPGHLCVKHTNLILILLITLVIFVLYIFQNPYTNIPQSISNNNVVPYSPQNNDNIEETELRKEKLRQEIKQIKEDSNVTIPSYKTHLRNKAYERVVNPLLPPERSYEATYGIPINIPTRGPEGGNQQIGYIFKEGIDDDTKDIGKNSEPVMLPLYGAPTFTGSNKWMYYIASDKYNSIKMPIQYKNKNCDSEFGCDELYDEDVVDVPSYNGKFKVKIYDYDKPKYIPYIF